MDKACSNMVPVSRWWFLWPSEQSCFSYLSLTHSMVFPLKRPTFDTNPTRLIDDIFVPFGNLELPPSAIDENNDVSLYSNWRVAYVARALLCTTRMISIHHTFWLPHLFSLPLVLHRYPAFFHKLFLLGPLRILGYRSYYGTSWLLSTFCFWKF